VFVQGSFFKGSLIWPESFQSEQWQLKGTVAPFLGWKRAGRFCACFVASLCVPPNGNIKAY